MREYYFRIKFNEKLTIEYVAQDGIVKDFEELFRADQAKDVIAKWIDEKNPHKDQELDWKNSLLFT